MASRSYTRTMSDIDTEIDEEIEQEQNPIKKNAVKFANQKQILTGVDLIKRFKTKYELKHTETLQKIAFITDPKEHESTDYLRGKLNILQEFLNDCESIISHGTRAELHIVEEENKKNSNVNN